MNKFLAIALAAGVTFAVAGAAEARDGCGRGGFRGPAGHCRPLRGGGVIVAPGIVVGGFYPGRGYWDGRRYYARRYHYRGGWRYR